MIQSHNARHISKPRQLSRLSIVVDYSLTTTPTVQPKPSPLPTPHHHRAEVTAGHSGPLAPNPQSAASSQRTNSPTSAPANQHDTSSENNPASLRKFEALLIGDSIMKHVARERFMCRNRAQLQRTSMSITAHKAIDEWPTSDTMQYAVLHVGVNDVWDGAGSDNVVENIKYVLNKMQSKFRNAKLPSPKYYLLRKKYLIPK